MVNKKPKTVLYRRKREGKTNYKKRLRLLMAEKPRLIVRITNQRIIAQLVKFTVKGDIILAGVDSSALKKEGWNYSGKNIPAAYLTGLLFSKVVLKKGYKEGILDTGLRLPLKKGKIYAFLKGVLDNGFDAAYGNEDIFPEEGRISGKHIQEFADKIKENEDVYKQRFAQYLKNNLSPEKITEKFKEIKQKLMVK